MLSVTSVASGNKWSKWLFWKRLGGAKVVITTLKVTFFAWFGLYINNGNFEPVKVFLHLKWPQKYKDLYMAANIYCLYLTFSKSCPKCGNIWVILQGKNLVILAETSFSDLSKDFFRRILKFFIWQHCQWLFSKLFLAKNKCWIFIALFIEMIQSTAENFPSLVFNNVSEHK